MTNRPQPLRMPVQLMRSKTERAQCPAADRMTAHSRNAHRPSGSHPYFHPASVRAQRAGRQFHFHWTARGLRNPWPVLAPDRSVIQQLPGNRRHHETRCGSRAPYQQISSRDLHASPLLVATEAAHLDVVTAVAVFAVAHLHAFMRRTPQPRNGMSPDVAAVSTDPVQLVHTHLVRLAIRSNDIPCKPNRRASHGSHARTTHSPAAAHRPATESRGPA